MLARETAKGHEVPAGHREAPRRQERTIWTAWEAPGREERTNWTACEAPGRQERINWTACDAPGRQERTIWTAWEAAGRHQGLLKAILCYERAFKGKLVLREGTRRPHEMVRT